MLVNRCWNCMGDLENNSICPHCGFDTDKYQISPHTLAPNTILHGKYLVGNVLGQGGFGITYIGFDLTLEMKVAIKEYFPSDKVTRNNMQSNKLQWRQSESLDDSWRTGCVQFLAEARKMAKINSIPEIVSVRDTFEENNTAYIVMDYVPGKTMKEYMRQNGCFTYSDCVNLLMPLIDGLDKVHRQGIIHRDISPDNLMITPNGKVYLLDLGAAKDMKDTSGQHTSASKRGFSPIEQNAGNGRIGPWTDVYALAASIYYCVYGKVVPSSIERFNDDTLSFEKKGKNPLATKQVEVLKKGLAIQPELRYQNAMDFYMALKESIGEKKPVGKIIGAVVGVAAVLAVAIGGFFLMETKPWLPSVEIGMPAVTSSFLDIPEQYAYFTDLDGALVRVAYNNEEKTFYVDTAEIIYEQDDTIEGDGVNGIALTENFVYFTYYGGKGNSDYLIAMDFDGTNQRQLFELEKDHTVPLYTKFSDGKEYFYYLMDDGIVEDENSEEEEYHLYLYRYDLQSDVVEQVLEDELVWYLTFDRYLYYIKLNEETENYELYRTTLTGEDTELLDDTHNFISGFEMEGQLYLTQMTNAAGEYNLGIVACDKDGVPLDGGKGVYTVDYFNDTYTIGGGWLFYSKKNSDDLYRVRLDGTGNEKILSGYSYDSLSYGQNQLYFRDGTYIEDEFHPYQAYFACYDGSWIVPCSFELQALTDEQGCQYVIEDGMAKMVGYVGTDTDVILPLEFNGYPFNENFNSETFYTENVQLEDLSFYAEMPVSELTYKKNANGIIITGYTGAVTGGISQVAIPSEIDGTPVIRIDDEAFAGCTFKRVYLPKQLEEIGSEAFDECTELKVVIFPDTLKRIESYAFYKCSFDGQDIVIPDSVEHLGSGFLAFTYPNSVQLPASLDSVGNGFLSICSGEFVVAADHKNLKVVDGVLLSKGGATLYAYPFADKGEYTVPSTVTKIWGGAFQGCQLRKVTLPEGLLTIGDEAFRLCINLTTIKIPRSVQSLGEDAFESSGIESATLKWGIKGKADAFDEGVRFHYYGDND